MSVIITKSEVIIEMGKGTSFISDGHVGEKRALGFGNHDEEEASVIIVFEDKEAVSRFISDVTNMLGETGA